MRADEVTLTHLYIYNSRLRVERSLVDNQTWAHGSADAYALNVDALRSRRLQTLQVSNQRFHVFFQLAGFKANFTDRGVDDAVLSVR